jgi:hypothetical protein
MIGGALRRTYLKNSTIGIEISFRRLSSLLKIEIRRWKILLKRQKKDN